MKLFTNRSNLRPTQMMRSATTRLAQRCLPVTPAKAVSRSVVAQASRLVSSSAVTRSQPLRMSHSSHSSAQFFNRLRENRSSSSSLTMVTNKAPVSSLPRSAHTVASGSRVLAAARTSVASSSSVLKLKNNNNNNNNLPSPKYYSSIMQKSVGKSGAARNLTGAAWRSQTSSMTWRRSMCTKAEEKPETETEAINTGEDETPKDEKDIMIDKLYDQIKILEATLNDKQEQILHARADLENTRRRAKTEVEHAKEYGIQKFVASFLPVIDDLDRCLVHAPSEEVFESADQKIRDFYEGVTMTSRQLNKVLGNHGITGFNPQDEVFDPKSMDAIFTTADAQKYDNQVSVVLKKGFFMKDKLLRAAEVGVNKSEKKFPPKEEEKKEE